MKLSAKNLLLLSTLLLMATFTYADDWNAQALSWITDALQLRESDIPALEAKARAGDERAAYILYLEVSRPRYKYRSRVIPQEQFAWAKQMADAGNPLGMRMLCHLYQHEWRGVEKDENRALHWCEKSASAGYVPAMNELAKMYTEGTGTTKDLRKSFQWYEKAFNWYERAALSGNAYGMAGLGWLYENGNGIGKNISQAFAWYFKAAQAGSSWGMRNLGVMYRDGRGTSKDPVIALNWLSKAAKAGDASAWRFIGWMHLNKDGQYPGVPHDDELAFAAFEKAVALGDSSAGVTLGWLHEQGKGTRRNFQKAAEWYEWAAEAGEVNGMTNLGIFFADGIHGVEDHEMAVKWFTKAANLGSADAKTRLAGYFERGGGGITKQEVEAIRIYREAAQSGNTYAMYRLGVMLDEGRGLDKPQPDEAEQWLDKAQANGQGKNVVWYRDEKKLMDFAQRLEIARQKIARQIPGFRQRNTMTAELRGTESPEQLMIALRQAGSLEKACEQGLVTRNACQDSGALLRVRSLQDLQNATIESMLVRLALKQSPLDSGDKPTIQGSKATLSIYLNTDAIKTNVSLSDPDARSRSLAQISSSIGAMLASSVPRSGDEQVLRAGLLAGPLIEDVMLTFADRYGPDADQCISEIVGVGNISLEEISRGGTRKDRVNACAQNILKNKGSEMVLFAVKAAIPIVAAFEEVYGPKLDKDMRTKVAAVLDFLESKYLEPPVQISGDLSRVKRTMREDLNAQLGQANKPLPEMYSKLMEGFDSLLDKIIEHRAVGVLALASVNKYLAGQPTGVVEADAILEQMSNQLQKIQRTAVLRLSLRQEEVTGFLGRKSKVWVLAGVTMVGAR